MKQHHGLAYAAAILRNAKDDEQTVEVLRELDKEGVRFTPFDAELSDINWSTRDGQLLGGYTNLVGVGMIKGTNFVNRRNTTGLTKKDRTALAKLEPKHHDLRPAHTLWGSYYSDPGSINVNGIITEFAHLEDQENAVVICRLIRQETRDENDPVRVAKRGYTKNGQTLFVDLFVVDDSITKPIRLRLDAKLWFVYGRKVANRSTAGKDWFLVRGRWLGDYSMMSGTKIKCLNKPDLFD